MQLHAAERRRGRFGVPNAVQAILLFPLASTEGCVVRKSVHALVSSFSAVIGATRWVAGYSRTTRRANLLLSNSRSTPRPAAVGPAPRGHRRAALASWTRRRRAVDARNATRASRSRPTAPGNRPPSGLCDSGVVRELDSARVVGPCALIRTCGRVRPLHAKDRAVLRP